MRNSNQRPDGFTDPRTIYALTEFILGQFARTLTVFFRYDFGARYFNIVDILGSSFTLLFIGGFIAFLFEVRESNSGSDTTAKITSAATNAAQDNSFKVLIFFLFAFLIMCAVHILQAWNAKKKRPIWHSRYSGTSHLSVILPTSAHAFIETEIALFLGISERYLIQRFIEPFIAFVAGVVLLSGINQPLGAWFTFSALSLGFVEWIDNARAKNRLFDSIDAQIESQNLGEAIRGAAQIRGTATAGFVMPVSPNLKPKQQQDLAEGMTRLDPALEAILHTPDAAQDLDITEDPDDPENTVRNLTNP